VTGTPTLVFESGIRISGALTAGEMEKQLIAAEAEKSSTGRKR